MKCKATNGAQTQTCVPPNLNQIQCSRRRAMGVGTQDNTRCRATGVGAICCNLLLFLHVVVLFHFHASYNFCPLQILKYTIECRVASCCLRLWGKHEYKVSCALEHNINWVLWVAGRLAPVLLCFWVLP